MFFFRPSVSTFHGATRFLLAIVLLLLGYLLYSKVIERIVEVDPDRPTPAVAHPDGVDYVPMKPWRIYLIQFLKTDLG